LLQATVILSKATTNLARSFALIAASISPIGAREMARALQTDKQALDVVKFDGIAREARHVVRKAIGRRLGIGDLKSSCEAADIFFGLRAR
jgi:hypothetical protein